MLIRSFGINSYALTLDLIVVVVAILVYRFIKKG